MGTSSVPSQEPKAPWEKVALSPDDAKAEKEASGTRATRDIRDKMHELTKRLSGDLGMH